MSARGPVLGIDYGTRRLGLAVTDAEARFAFPAPALVRSRPARDLAALRELIRERGITGIVVGLPIHLDGRSGPEAEAARAFARKLGEATGLMVEMQDERWTSIEATRALRAVGAGPRRRRGRQRQGPDGVDSAAAAILLRTWLSAREGGAPPVLP